MKNQEDSERRKNAGGDKKEMRERDERKREHLLTTHI